MDIKDDIKKKLIKDLSLKAANSFYPHINSKTALKNIDRINYEKLIQTQLLTWQCLLNSHYQEAYNHDFVNSFPTQGFSLPIFIGNEIYNSINSINIKLKTRYSMSMNQLLYDYIAKDGVFELSFEDFIWAYTNVLTRKYSLIVQENPIEILVPILDYLNHSSINDNVEVLPYYDKIADVSYVLLLSTKDIESEQQLLRNYGTMNNMLYYMKYGFFEEQNLIKEISIPFIGENLSQTLKEQGIKLQYTTVNILDKINQAMNDNIKIQLLRRYNININDFLESEIKLFDNKFDSSNIKFLRIIFLENTDKDAEKILKHNFDTLYSRKNEKLVLDFLRQHLNIFLDNLKKEEDYYTVSINKLGNIDSLEKYKMKNILRLENEEKELIIKNIKFIENKQNNLI